MKLLISDEKNRRLLYFLTVEWIYLFTVMNYVVNYILLFLLLKLDNQIIFMHHSNILIIVQIHLKFDVCNFKIIKILICFDMRVCWFIQCTYIYTMHSRKFKFMFYLWTIIFVTIRTTVVGDVKFRLYEQVFCSNK